MLRQHRLPAPRPLPLHMAVLTLTWMVSRAALPLSSAVSPSWRPDLREAAANLQQNLQNLGASPEAFARAVEAEAFRRLEAFAAGAVAFNHARPHRPAEPSVAWAEGTTRLLDYGRGGGGIPLLVVPSLVNRAYVLDLTGRRSLMRWLARRGFRPFLVDWGAPGEAERAFTLTDYIAGRLDRALDAVLAATGRPVGLVGYCMGGMLALPLAQRRPAAVAAFAALATPWDFHAVDAGRRRVLQALAPGVRRVVEDQGLMPVDVLQAMFASLDPYQTPRKFQAFAGWDKRSARAKAFVAVETWLNDGVPLAGPVAVEALLGWYLDNTPARGEWLVAGRPVRPAEVRCPSLVVVPGRDIIVPPDSALALAKALPGADCRVLDGGHVGMVVGSRAIEELYRPLASWLRHAAAASPVPGKGFAVRNNIRIV
ncbi:MAG: alpha/beta fold hydrolase [Magnetospirillum sp. WYHS-4]